MGGEEKYVDMTWTPMTGGTRGGREGLQVCNYPRGAFWWGVERGEAGVVEWWTRHNSVDATRGSMGARNEIRSSCDLLQVFPVETPLWLALQISFFWLPSKNQKVSQFVERSQKRHGVWLFSQLSEKTECVLFFHIFLLILNFIICRSEAWRASSDRGICHNRISESGSFDFHFLEIQQSNFHQTVWFSAVWKLYALYSNIIR